LDSTLPAGESAQLSAENQPERFASTTISPVAAQLTLRPQEHSPRQE
jgi:hypothetical protein